MDRIGKYFKCFRRATGESTQILIRYSLENQLANLTYEFDHADKDGFAALRDFPSQIFPDTRQKPRRRPSLFQQFKLMAKHFQAMATFPNPTKMLDYSQASGNSSALEVLHANVTDNIKAFCSAQGISIGSFLIWTLHRAIGSDSCLWSLPINLRGSGAIADGNHNQSVPCFFHLAQTESARDIHRKIHRQLTLGHHWGVFRTLNLLSYLPGPLYVYVIKKDEKRLEDQGRWFATFSNLGNLQNIGKDIQVNELVIPTNSRAPIKCVSLSRNGELLLALNVHSTFAIEGAPDLLRVWQKTIADTLRLGDQTR